MKSLDSVLGLVFEGAFKLGFLKGRIADYKDFTEGVFGKLKAEAEKDIELLRIIEDIEPTFPKYNLFNPTDNMKHLSKLMPVGSLEEENSGIKREWKEIYTKLVFTIGFASGYFYSKNFKNLELKKYDLGDESQSIIWQNADLVFLENKTLYVIDFKLGGTRKVLREILTDSRKRRMPIGTYGVPVNLSIGELEFYNFLKKFMQVKDKIMETEDVFVENKGLLQVLSYAVDFLCTEEDEVKEVSLGLLYPMQEPLSLRFFVKEREKLKEFLEGIKDLYRSIKGKEGPYKKADTENRIRQERIMEKTKEALINIEKELQEREKGNLLLETGDINLVRSDVKERLEKFAKNPEPVKAITLLHSAGSGKTSRTRELILNLPGKHIVLYTATRLVLLDREYKKLEEIKKNSNKSIELVYERKAFEEGGFVADKGTHFQEPSSKPGKIMLVVNKIDQLVKDKSPDIIWAFATIQAFVETVRDQKTSEHLNLFLRPRFEDYHIHIILDEFLGNKNGFFAIGECFKFLKKLKDNGRKASLYIFDANGYSPNLVIKLLKEYKEFDVIPEALVLTDYEEGIKTEYEGISFEVYAKHGFPANGLVVRKKFIKIEGKIREREEEIAKHVAMYIKNTLNKEKSTGFAFIQDKGIINRLSKELENLGLSSIVAHASSKKTQDSINKGNEDIILGTSSVSRGVDFSRPHKPVDYIYILVQSWGIENNLVETIQAISRSRGDEETESRQKELHLIYTIDQNIDKAVENIASYLEHQNKELVRLIYTKEQLEGFLDLDDVITKIVKNFLSKPDRKVLVPVPTQHKSKFIDNVVSKYENVVSFLEDIRDIEGGDEIRNFIKDLERLAYMYTSIKENLQEFSYYAPYILLESYPIFLRTDNKRKNKLKFAFEKIKGILKEHNKERTEDVKSFLERASPKEQINAPLLMPVYSIVFVKNWLRKNEKLDFVINKRVGRGHAEVLGGGLEPRTLCYLSDSDIEYACIPMRENYPYKEVLYGRFAKFPVKFIKNLLEG